MPHEQKATNFIKQKRLDELITMMGRGMMRYQIIAELAPKWNMSESGVQKYINAANSLLANSFSDEDIIAAYKSIYHKTYDESPALALKAMDSIAKIKKNGFSPAIPNTITIKFDGENEELKSD